MSHFWEIIGALAVFRIAEILITAVFRTWLQRSSGSVARGTRTELRDHLEEQFRRMGEPR